MKFAAWSTARSGFALIPLAGLLVAGCKSDKTAITESSVLRVAEENYQVSATERPPKDTVDVQFPPGHSVPDDELRLWLLSGGDPTEVEFEIVSR